jgi:hypothetical protein
VGHRSRSQDSWASSISASWSEWRFLRFDRSPTLLDLEMGERGVLVLPPYRFGNYAFPEKI